MTVEGVITPAKEFNTLQSYDDAIAGRSSLLFYGLGTTMSGGTSYALAKEGGLSNPTTVAAINSVVAYNFDITINKPTIIAGICLVDLKASADTTNTNHVKVELIHYDGSTETVLGSATTANINSTTISTKMKFTATRKSFGIGKTLRVKATLTAAPVGTTVTLYINPAVAGDEFKIWVPVVNLE